MEHFKTYPVSLVFAKEQRARRDSKDMFSILYMTQEFYVTPTIGPFYVSVTPCYHFNDRTHIEYTILNIEGGFDKGIHLTFHAEDSSRSTEAILHWTEVIGTTESQAIKGEATVKMVQLACTILRDIAPYVTWISLSDMSFFMCDTPEGKKKVALPPFHIAFHNKTWYEDKFNATLLDPSDHQRYRACVQALHTDPKPGRFEFINDRLTELLSPLYTSSTTWKEFFMLIEKHYPRDKCALVYPWIEGAISHIFKENGGDELYVGRNWKIDLATIPKIHYYEVDPKKKQGGSLRYERQYFHHRDRGYNDIRKWDVDRFLKRKTHTRKSKTSHRSKRKTKKRGEDW